MNKIDLSAIIPTHNSQNTIERLLLSINNSPSVNFNKFEVIIVDDGSKDDTIKIVRKMRSIVNCQLLIVNC